MCMQLNSDEDIVKAILLGGKEREMALEKLYTDGDCKRKVIKYVQSNHGNNADGKDLFHDGIIVADRNIRNMKFRGDSSLHYYIYSICKYLWLNRIKKNKRVLYPGKDLKEEIGKRNPETIYMDNELKENLSEALDLLGDRCKKILELWKLNYSMKEIAEKLDIKSEGMARKLKHQCYQKLLKLVEENPGLRKNLK